MTRVPAEPRPRALWWLVMLAAVLTVPVVVLLSTTTAGICIDRTSDSPIASSCEPLGATVSIGPAGWIVFAIAALAVIIASWQLVAARRSRRAD